MLRIQHLFAVVVGGVLAGSLAQAGFDGQDPAADVAEQPQPDQPPVDDATAQDDGEGDEETAPPQRVVLQTGRFESVSGIIEREERDLIVLRIAESDEIKSFLKNRLLRVTRLVEPSEDQRGTVILTDGSRRQGIVISDDYDRVMLEIEGILTRFERAVVDHVELEPTPIEVYQQYKAMLQPEMYERRLELCQWLIDQRLYAEAETELVALQEDKPDFTGVDPLLRLVQAQIALLADVEEEIPAIEEEDGSEVDPETGPVDQADLLPTELLSDADVNIIRVYEMDFENPPRIKITPETIRTLVETHASNPVIPGDSEGRAALFRREPIDIVRLMFEVRARELYPEIEVLTEPYSMNLFRQRVHNTWLINNCATSACHGGVRAGRLFLHNQNHIDENVRYTNFLILDRLVLDPQKPLINYDEPALSKIIQHGLPVTEARDPHPEVDGWKPVFNRGNRQMLEDALEWIRSMYVPRPEYPVEYAPPDLGASGTGGGDPTGR